MTSSNSNRVLRSKEHRWMLWNWAGGKCAICGCAISVDDFHADHKIPYSKTGRTNVYEMQALCASCNLKKGKSYGN